MRVDVLFALLSAVCFAASHVVSRRALATSSITAGFMVIVGSAWLVVSIPVLLNPPSVVPARAVVVFAISGLFAPAIARAAALAGVFSLGPSITVPIQQGLRPLLVLPAAVIFLGEGFGVLRIAGALAIVVGGLILSRQPIVDIPVPADAAGDERGDVSDTSVVRARSRQRTAAPSRRFRPGVMYPVAAAVAYSTSDILVKSGLRDVSEPAFGAMVSIGSGLLMWCAGHALPAVRQRFHLGSGLGWLLASGGFMGAAILLLFNALDRGDVSVVAPVVATQPLFVFMFSALILRHLERIDRSTVVAGMILMVGTVLISI